MVVKIYLPKDFYKCKELCELYGDVVIEEKSISYYIISNSPANPDLRLLGHVRPAETAGTLGYSVVFCFNENEPHIYLYSLNVKLPEDVSVNLFLYDAEQFYYTDTENQISREFIENGDVYFLRSLIKSEIKTTTYPFEDLGMMFFQFFAEIFQTMTYMFEKVGFLNKIISSTTLFEHAKIWQRYVMQKGFHSGIQDYPTRGSYTRAQK